MQLIVTKPLLVLSLCTVLACGSAASQGRPPSAQGSAAQGSPAHAPGLHGSLQWLGGPTALIERGGLQVLTDPMLGPRGEHAFVLPKHPSSGVLDAAISRYTSPPSYSLEGLDAILVSHTHADHFDAHAKQLLPKHLPLVVAAGGAEAMRAAGFTDVRPLDWGQSLTLTAGNTQLHVRAVPAHHAHEPALDQQLGRGNGYVLEWKDERGSFRVYWTGDAVVSNESETLRSEYGAIDLLLPHLGGVGGDGGAGLRTMTAEEAIELVRRVDPGLVVPIHHTTFGHYREPIEAMQQRASESGDAARFRFLREGERLPLSTVVH